jgi:hypothetical protein
MKASESWDWQVGKRVLADLAQIRSSYSRVDELIASADGEKLAASVKTGDDEFTACVNGEAWPESFELCWYLRFSPFGKLIALVRIDDEWTLAVDGVPWEQRFEYAWDPIFSADGKAVALACKRDNLYGVAVDDKAWEDGFQGMRHFCVIRRNLVSGRGWQGMGRALRQRLEPHLQRRWQGRCGGDPNRHLRVLDRGEWRALADPIRLRLVTELQSTERFARRTGAA